MAISLCVSGTRLGWSQAFMQILKERTEATLPGLREVPLPWAEYGLTDSFTAQHTAVQYATVCAELMS